MLEICQKYFEHLNTNQIRYCHWKSNEHLDAALNGKTDIDILVHPDDKNAFEKTLVEFDIKEILSPKSKQFPGLVDYLGFDQKTGSFIHLHVHYRLILGQKYIKNHWLPIEDLVFNNLIQKDNVNIPCPEIELILLVIRAHVKTDVISLIKHAIKGTYDSNYTAFPQAIEQEFRQLIKISDPEKVRQLLNESGLPLAIEKLERFFEQVKNNKLKANHIFRLQVYVLKQLKDYRRTKSLLIYISYISFFINALTIVQRFKTGKKKTLVGEGKILSIVGADGSGKSTLSADLSKWLSWKLTTTKHYYGIPKTRTNKTYSFLMRGFNKFGLTYLNQLMQCLFWMYVAREREKVSLLTAQNKALGEIALTDRFPLKSFQSMDEPMDGPRINKVGIPIASFFSDRENVIYNTLQYPDLLFILQVDIEELRRRKTDLPLDTHTLKANAVNNISANEKNVVLIDANQPYEEVLLTIKRKIWSVI